MINLGDADFHVHFALFIGVNVGGIGNDIGNDDSVDNSG